MFRQLKSLVHKVGREYVDKLSGDEFLSQEFRRHNERPIEFRFVFESMTNLRPKTVLDVGTGTTALPHLIASCGCVVTAIDNVKDYWPKGMFNRHWRVLDQDILKPTLCQHFDMVTCVSVIEHIADHVTAFRNLVSLVTPGGHLLITTPYSEQHSVPNVYKLPGAAYGQQLPYICRSTSRHELDEWLKQADVELVLQEFWRLWTGPVWTQGEFLSTPEQVSASDTHQLSCMLFRKPGRHATGTSSARPG